MAKHLSYYCVKAVRISGWVLLVLVILYMVSGWALCGSFGFDRLMSAKTAERIHIHVRMDVLFALFLLIHVLPSIYLAMKRWRWIGRPARK